MILYSLPVPSSQKGKTLLDCSLYPPILTIPKLFLRRKLFARHDLYRQHHKSFRLGVYNVASFDDTDQSSIALRN